MNQKRAAQRAAKERLRMARLLVPDRAVDWHECPLPKGKPGGFRIVVTCLDDGESVVFNALRGPHGLTISPTLAGRKVAAVLYNYSP